MCPSGASILVSIVSTNDGHWLGACLDSLIALRAQVDVVVVANMCNDQTEEICARSPLEVAILRTSARLGFAACNNLCLTKALQEGYEYAFLLNPDTRVHPRAIDSLLDFMRSREKFGIVGSLQIEYGDETWSQLNEWSQITLDHAATLGSREKHANGLTWIEHYYVQGAAMMLRLTLTRRIGLLDPVYRTFYEETDLCRRSLMTGQKVAILLDSKVQHYGGGNWKADIKRHQERDRLFLRNQFLYYMSGAESRPLMIFEAVRVLAHGIKTVLLHREDVILPWWQYISVVWSAAFRLKDIFRLYRRNRIIHSGGFVPESLWQVGSDPGYS
jgi:GT2 family glycosyltransferase